MCKCRFKTPLCLTETHLSDDVPDSFLDIRRYNLFRVDLRGGAVVMITDNYLSKIYETYKHPILLYPRVLLENLLHC